MNRSYLPEAALIWYRFPPREFPSNKTSKINKSQNQKMKDKTRKIRTCGGGRRNQSNSYAQRRSL
jgi:hypothetical protein